MTISSDPRQWQVAMLGYGEVDTLQNCNIAIGFLDVDKGKLVGHGYTIA